MRVIQNEMVAFRCPNTLKDRLNEIALASDMHVSQVVRIACAELVIRRSATGKTNELQPIAWR